MKVAIYPGSFDPITVGHMDIVERATVLFDKVIISVAETDMKNPLFSSEERLDLVSSIYADNEKIEVKVEEVVDEVVEEVKDEIIAKNEKEQEFLDGIEDK